MTGINQVLLSKKIFNKLALVTFVILLIPAIGMIFSEDVSWSLPDFLIMGALIFGIGSIAIFISRKLGSQKQQIAALFIGIALFLFIWAELAVGLFTNLGS